MAPISTDAYLERVYAGVLGKIVGVYLGRPFEGWSYQRIAERFGAIEYYVHEQLAVALVVTDDDISGTFTFLRALPEHGNDAGLTPKQIGDTWLNTIIENKTILWWGGCGVSTEHTAYLRLKSGVDAPESGSAQRNGRTCAEQIGAQIFIDGWGLVCPGDPERAADLAKRAASVSHDGEAIYGAQIIAALVAGAFVENGIDGLIDCALQLIPADSLIFRLIDDVRQWHRESPGDWCRTRQRVQERYGYDCYGGACHIVPNHALVILALLHGNGDFDHSISIVNSCGWDTDCNSGNVGCILGVRNGLDAFTGERDWRGPVADRLFLCSADGGRCVTDALTEAYAVANIGLALQGSAPVAPKNGARFHFSQPGSVQGFTAEEGQAHLSNPDGSCLLIQCLGSASHRIHVSTPTFIQPSETHMPTYDLMASPTLYPGQMAEAEISATGAAAAKLFIGHYGANDEIVNAYGAAELLVSNEPRTLRWRIPETDGQPIARIGVQIEPDEAGASALLHSLGWSGEPECSLGAPADGEMWRSAWVSSMSRVEMQHQPRSMRLVQNQGAALITQGTREWANYSVSTTITPLVADGFGLCARIQGLRRYYLLALVDRTTVELRKVFDGTSTILARKSLVWEFGQPGGLELSVSGDRLAATINGGHLFDGVCDSALAKGYVGIWLDTGTVDVLSVTVKPND